MGRPNTFDGMLHEFCAGLGFCGGDKNGKRLHVTDLIPEAGPVSADDLAKWLILADGLDPDQEDHWIPKLKAVFVKHMGTDVVDASRLHSDYCDT
jgi:hypothetical protein